MEGWEGLNCEPTPNPSNLPGCLIWAARAGCGVREQLCERGHAERREDERIRDGGTHRGREVFRTRSVVPGCLTFLLLTRTLALCSFLSSLRFANQTSPINRNPGSVGVWVCVCVCERVC